MASQPIDLDAELAREPVLNGALEALQAHLARSLDPARRPQRPRTFHMDHEGRHWEDVRINAETVWRLVCENTPAWHTSEAVFLVRTASLLHDIAMICHPEYVPVTPHTRNRLLSMGHPGDAFDDITIDSPLGQFLRRKYQGEIGCSEVHSLTRDVLQNVPRETNERLKFLVEHYSHRTFEKQVRDRAAQLDPPNGKRLLAIASVLQLADWAHLDRSRISPEDLQARVRDNKAVPDEIPILLTRHLRVDCGDLFSLPVLFRSHYVFGRDISPVGATEVRFDVRLALPPGLRKSNDDAAFRQLSFEWREHLLPSRMAKPTADDHLREFASLTLRYREPAVEENVSDGEFLAPIPFVVDCWIASQWFNLGLGAQLAIPDLKERRPIDEFLGSFENESLYTEFNDKSGGRAADKPHLSRRVFLFLHSKLTGGHPVLAARFFRQFQHEMCCVHERLLKGSTVDYKVCAFHAFACIDAQLEREWPGARQLDQQEWKVASEIARQIWQRDYCSYPGTIERAAIDVPGVPKDAVESALRRCADTKAIEIADKVISLAGHSVGGAYLALVGSPFHLGYGEDLQGYYARRPARNAG